MYLNKVYIIGNLTRDPEVKAIPSGTKVANFSVATNRVWNDQNGKRQEATEFHNVVVFGRQGETAGQYLKKGSSVLVEGRLQTRSWDDKTSGEKKYRTEIIAERVQFGQRPGGGGGAGSYESKGSATSSPAKKEEVDTIEYPDEEINPEDIPF